jgi:hypothetical protein
MRPVTVDAGWPARVDAFRTLAARAADALAREAAPLDRAGRALLAAVLDALEAPGQRSSLAAPPRRLAALDAQAKREGLDRAIRQVARLAWLAMLRDLPARRPRVALGPVLLRETVDLFERLLTEPAEVGTSQLAAGAFVKDVRVAQLRMALTGTQVLEFPFRPPLYHFTGSTPLATVTALRALGWRGIAGFGRFEHSHEYRGYRERYTLEGFTQSYLRIAAFLAANSGCTGHFGVSWVQDPAVARLSPHLAFVRQFQEGMGGVFWAGRASAAARALATETSATRRRAVEEGRYRPRNYCFVIHRRDLLRWARAHPEWPSFAEG